MNLTLREIMTKEVMSVKPEMPMLAAAKILTQNKFHGLPVVDSDNKLIGLFTEYDLISSVGDDKSVHLPTLQTVISNLRVFGKDKHEFKKEIKEISNLKVG